MRSRQSVWSAVPGRPLLEAYSLDLIAKAAENLRGPVELGSLDFKLLAFDRSACPALILELGKCRTQLLLAAAESSDHRDQFPAFAFVDPNLQPLFLGRDVGLDLWRALASLDFRLTTVTQNGPLQGCSIK